MSDTVASPPRPRDATRQVWTERLTRFATANQTVAQFCAAEGVSVPSFYGWKRRLTTVTPAVIDPLPLLPVHLAATSSPLEFVLPGGTVLRVPPDTAPTTLVPWLRLLGVLPC